MLGSDSRYFAASYVMHASPAMGYASPLGGQKPIVLTNSILQDASELLISPHSAGGMLLSMLLDVLDCTSSSSTSR